MQPERRQPSRLLAVRRGVTGVREKLPHLAVFGLLLSAACAAWAAAPIERVSVSSAEVQGNSISWDPSTSADGRYVSFTSEANNLVVPDANPFEIFVRDVATGTTERIAVSSSEVPANNASSDSAISADGRYVAFQSNSTNLIDGQVMTSGQLYVRDRVAGTTEIVSVSSAEVPGNGTAFSPAISANGRYVAFTSASTNLVAGSGTTTQVFLRDRSLGTTEIISRSSGGTVGNNFSYQPAINSTGTIVAFVSLSDNLIAGGTNENRAHIYTRDRTTNTTELIDVDSLGVEANGHANAPTISNDGRYVAYASQATGGAPFDDETSQIYLRDRLLDVTELVSVNPPGGGQEASFPSISGDGRYVAYQAESAIQIPGDTNNSLDIFVRDRQAGVVRVSVNAAGTVQGNSHSRAPSMSADGNHVAFESEASNLVASDTNNFTDVFIRDLEQGLAPVEPGVLTAAVDPAMPRTRIKINWGDSSSNETGFQLERSGPSIATTILNANANAVLYLDSGRTPDTLHFYRVRAVNAAGASGWSNYDAATTYPELPDAPFELSATVINKTRIDLHWGDGSFNEDGFKIERRIGAGAYSQIATVGANVEFFSSTGLTPGTLYFFRVRAFNAPGGVQNSAYTNQAGGTTIPNAPTAPNTLAAIATNSTTVGLTWVDAANNETGFSIERRVGVGAYSVIASRPANTTSYTDGSRSPNTNYTYRVRAINAGGPSGYSNAAIVITLGAPSNLTATPVSPTQINLAWTDNSPSDTGFKIERETGGVWAQIATVAAGVTTYNNTGLTANTAYKYRVRAYRTGSDSTFSNVVNVSTPAP